MKDSGTSHVSESMDFSGADEAISAGLALRRYTTRKQQIASEIRRLMNLSKGSFREKWNEDLHQLMVKLAEDRFVLSVAGQFNRGKSSLMNAIIGRDVLPTGVLPVTSVVTILKYGTVDRLLVHLDGRRLPLEVPLLTLAQYVTQEGNPGNEKKVLRAMVETPSPLLRRGIEFVDTPGVGSAVDSNTLTTLEFLPQSDAVIFVMSAEAPCTNAECEFLDRVRSHVRKIFFVLNKIDLLCEQEKESVVQSVERTLRNRLHDESIRIFPVSSLKSLRTSSDVDSPGRGDGGLRELEGTLSVHHWRQSRSFSDVRFGQIAHLREGDDGRDMGGKDYFTHPTGRFRRTVSPVERTAEPDAHRTQTPLPRVPKSHPRMARDECVQGSESVLG